MGKFKIIKQVTKKWTSGLTTIAVVGDGDHDDRNYIILDRVLIGRPQKKQSFNMHLKDWVELKKLIEGDLINEHEWPIQQLEGSELLTLQNLENILRTNPDFLTSVLSNKNLKNLSSSSFESLDKLGLRIYEIKTENLDFMLKKMSEAENSELSEFVAILNQLKLGQISTISELVRKKISILKLLENLLKKRDATENEIHKLLGSNLWLLDNNYDLVRSNQTLSDYLNTQLVVDKELGKRPDLIVKMFLQNESHIVIVELKRPNIKLNASHIGQILGYKGIIENHNPNIKILDLFLIGYGVSSNLPKNLSDVKILLLEDIVNKKKNELDEFLKVLDSSKENDFDIVS